jgi:hypothetical protein
MQDTLADELARRQERDEEALEKRRCLRGQGCEGAAAAKPGWLVRLRQQVPFAPRP